MIRAMFSGKIFRSRWAALLWAAGIIWTAYDVAEANAPPAHPAKAQHAQSTDASDAGASGSNPGLAILQKFADGN